MFNFVEGRYDTIIREMTKPELQNFTCVKKAQKLICQRKVSEALKLMIVDADKIRPFSEVLYDYISAEV